MARITYSAWTTWAWRRLPKHHVHTYCNLAWPAAVYKSQTRRDAHFCLHRPAAILLLWHYWMHLCETRTASPHQAALLQGYSLLAIWARGTNVLLLCSIQTGLAGLSTYKEETFSLYPKHLSRTNTIETYVMCFSQFLDLTIDEWQILKYHWCYSWKTRWTYFNPNRMTRKKNAMFLQRIFVNFCMSEWKRIFQ